MSEWIEIRAGLLPERGRVVWTSTAAGAMAPAYLDDADEWHFAGTYNGYLAPDPDFWMPLPMPPKS